MDTSIELQWMSFGPDRKYNVYRANKEDHIFIKNNPTPIDDDPSGNTYTITGLTADTIYVVYMNICYK